MIRQHARRIHAIAAALMLCVPLVRAMAADSPAAGPSLTIEAPTREAQATLAVGQVLTLTLRSVPSDEFGWSLRRPPGRAVEWIEGKAERDSGTAPRTHRAIGGEYVMRFRALAPGTAEVVLDYQRAFQTPSPPMRSVKLTKTVTSVTHRAD